jgi:uncharacterized membrane protein YfcA
MPDLLHLLGAFGAAFVAGAINSVAGGGTLISFPILIALGLSPKIANATNTVGIWWGALGSIWGFRPELARTPQRMRWLLLPAAIGSIGGAELLNVTSPETFERIVPWLILFSVVLFMIQAPIQKMLRSAEAAQRGDRSWMAMAVVAQLAVAVYGGYFGAGMSIMMLSILALIGMTDILEMSAMTSLLSLSINGVAGVYFSIAHLVVWPYAIAMGVGAILGGYLAAGLARRIGKVAIRRFVIAVGLTIAIVLFIRVARGS